MRKRKNIDIKRILELTEEGLALEQIAKQEEVSFKTLSNRIREAEGTPEYEEYKKISNKNKRARALPRRKNIDMVKILKLIKKGLTLKQIAKKENVSTSVLYNRIEKAKGTPEYEEYRQIKLLSQKSSARKQQYKLIVPNTKRLIVFILGNGATPEELTDIFSKKGIQINVREKLEQYIEEISRGRLKLTESEQSMVSYVQRLLNIKMEDIAELEKLASNGVPTCRMSRQTSATELVQRYNYKYGKNFSRLEMEFVLNRMRNAKGKISPSIYVRNEREILVSNIENLYDLIEQDGLQETRD